MRMDETIGKSEINNLIIDGSNSLDVQGVSIRAGQGSLKKGTVLSISTGAAGDNNHVILGTAPEVGEDLTVSCILADDVDATAEEVFATAYRSGHFNSKDLIVKEGYTITKDDIETLKRGGIYLSRSI